MELPVKATGSTELTSIADCVRSHAISTPDKVAITFEGRNTTYRALDRASDKVANGLAALGVRALDRIGILDKSRDCFFEIWLGLSKLNAVIVPINARLTGPEVQNVANDAKIKVLFVGEPFVDLVEKIRDRLTSVERIIVVNDGYEAWRDSAAADPVEYASSLDDVAIQLYTSGTTALPKGVQLTNLNMQTGMAEILEAWGNWGASDTAMVALPLFHIAGCATGAWCLASGLKIVLLRDFVPAQAIDIIQKERVTVTLLVPAMIMFLLEEKSIATADLTALRSIVYGAAPIPAELLRQALKRFSATGFVQIYGLTETTGPIACLVSSDHTEIEHPRMKSCGRPVAGVELLILGADGRPVRHGEVGEIVCRTRRNMKGYWNRTEETQKTLRNGWLYTGDAGYVDAEGYVYIQDRVKDMIVSGGENIYPAEVESAMFGHPSVADVAVIGIPDERWGESVKAIVVLKPGDTGNVEEILAYTRERLAGYKMPRSIDLIDVMPRNPSGKILKRELREKYWKGYERRVN